MAITTKALREQRVPLAKEIRRLSDEGLALDADGKYTEAWEKVNADYNALSRKIEASEHADKVEAEMAARVGDPDAGRGPARGKTNSDGGTMDPERARTLAMSAWCRAQYDVSLTEEMAEACRVMKVRPGRPELTIGLPNTEQARTIQRQFNAGHYSRGPERIADIGATLSDFSGPSGAYLAAPASMVRELEVNMLAFGGMRQAAETIRTATGERMAWPTADDTTNKGVQLGESVSIGSSVDPAFAQVFWDAYKFSSQPILVPYELLEDSVFDIPALIGRMFGERLGRITNDKYTTGSGVATPKGITVAASSFAASTTAIVADDVIKLYHSVDPAYRAGGGFMMHDTIIQALRLLKDGMGRYLWQSGMDTDQPDRLLGQRIVLNQSMDSTTTTGKKSILWGQLGKYKIRSVGSARMYRLQERYRDTDQDGFVMLIREDGNLLTTGTAPVKYLLH